MVKKAESTMPPDTSELPVVSHCLDPSEASLNWIKVTVAQHYLVFDNQSSYELFHLLYREGLAPTG
jgi:hypothetical protein